MERELETTIPTQDDGAYLVIIARQQKKIDYQKLEIRCLRRIIMHLISPTTYNISIPDQEHLAWIERRYAS